MEKKDLRKKVKMTTALLVIVLLIFGTFSAASILYAETSFHRILLASIIGGFTILVILLTIPVVNSYIKGITNSVNNITGVVSRLRKYGHIDDKSEEFQMLLKESESADQFGELATDFLGMMGTIIENIRTMEVIATGDLTVRAKLVSDKDSLGIAINAIVDSLSIMLDDIRKTSDQLNMGIIQFSSAAQSLAQSTAEQSATIEQLLLSVKDITEKSNENAQRSLKATELSGDIRDNAQGGHEQMEKMNIAMDDINSASQSISTVMKAIDDIAFQTNILSLNAAVEAARAGQHGKGFAVVADEVRNLATKSASAANDSNEMISNTLKKSKMGLDIVKDTSESLNTILSGVTNSVSLIDDIAKSTEEQSNAIEAINSGINQFSNVVYQNSATAEQSAAASDEMSTQTSQLIEMVSRFTIDTEYVKSIKGKKSTGLNAPLNISGTVNNSIDTHKSTDSFETIEIPDVNMKTDDIGFIEPTPVTPRRTPEQPIAPPLKTAEIKSDFQNKEALTFDLDSSDSDVFVDDVTSKY